MVNSKVEDNMTTAPRVICTVCELRSGDDLLPAGTELEVIIENERGARAVDKQGYIHVLRAADYVHAEPSARRV